MFFVAFFIFSCQKEELEIIEETPEGTLTDTSPLTVLLLRTSLNDGDIDDFIDGGDCFSIAFPFTVMINGTEIVIENEDDYEDIIDFLDEIGGSIDDIEIVFPITIILSDYTEIIVNNQEELNNYIANCEEEIDDDIDCVDFVYPITFFVYNSDTEITTTVVVNSDIELFLFLSNLGSHDFITIQYPISVILNNGTVVEINNNEELENIINECDDDDNDTSDLDEYLTTDTWFVAYFFDEGDETSNYCEFEFEFNTNGTVVASNGTDIVDGSWSTGVDSGVQYVELNFGEIIPFDELNDDWDVLNANMDIIELEDVSGGNGGIDNLTFDREPTLCDGGSTSDLEEYLTTDTWFVAYFFHDEDETTIFCEFEFDFNINGTVIASNGTDVVDGAWAVGIDSGVHYLEMDFGTDIPFDELNDDWDVLNASMDAIELEDISGGNGGTDYLTFDRVPTICNGGPTNLVDILQDGQWLVALYLDDGDDETSDYNDYVLTFNNDGTVIAENGTDSIDGTWDVTGSTGNLKLVLDFGASIPFDEFNDDWDVIDVQENRVELEDISGGNGGTDNLVFEKL